MENNTNNPGEWFDPWKDTFKNFFAPVPIHELAAIWITEPPPIVFCGETNMIKKKCRLVPGDMLLIVKGKIKDVTAYPTHEIKKCMGRINSDLHFILADTITGKELIIYI